MYENSALWIYYSLYHQHMLKTSLLESTYQNNILQND